MNRRDFLSSSLAAAALGTTKADAGALGGGARAQSGSTMRQIYELRQYHLRVTQRQQFSEYLRDVSVPALNRAGIEPVGVFSVSFGPESPSTWVLLTHKDMNSVATLDDTLQADEEYRAKGKEHHARPSSDPAYMRIDSQLMIAFGGMPALEKPAGNAAGEGRIFELRTYESHSKAAHRKKVEMFNEGEIEIFRKTGLAPVFFGSNLIGSRLPSLTYMLVFEDMAARENNWRTFVSSPEWKALSSKPEYADGSIVSNITSYIMRPGPGSQI
jgi:NIPSNAP